MLFRFPSGFRSSRCFVCDSLLMHGVFMEKLVEDIQPTYFSPPSLSTLPSFLRDLLFPFILFLFQFVAISLPLLHLRISPHLLRPLAFVHFVFSIRSFVCLLSTVWNLFLHYSHRSFLYLFAFVSIGLFQLDRFVRRINEKCFILVSYFYFILLIILCKFHSFQLDRFVRRINEKCFILVSYFYFILLIISCKLLDSCRPEIYKRNYTCKFNEDNEHQWRFECNE